MEYIILRQRSQSIDYLAIIDRQPYALRSLALATRFTDVAAARKRLMLSFISYSSHPGAALEWGILSLEEALIREIMES